MAKNIKKSISTAFRAWLILFLVLLIIIVLCYFKTLPVIKGYSESVAETIMLNTANEAVIRVLEDGNISYNDIAVLSKNEYGMVQSLEIDTYKINNLKSRISNEISKIINNREEFNISVPIGNFFNSPYTTGIGPKINFKMQLTYISEVILRLLRLWLAHSSLKHFLLHLLSLANHFTNLFSFCL